MRLTDLRRAVETRLKLAQQEYKTAIDAIETLERLGGGNPGTKTAKKVTDTGKPKLTAMQRVSNYVGDWIEIGEEFTVADVYKARQLSGLTEGAVYQSLRKLCDLKYLARLGNPADNHLTYRKVKEILPD